MKKHNLSLLLTFIFFVSQAAVAQTNFTLPELPYAYDALASTIDKETMKIHHTMHHQGYVDKLNKALEKTDGTQRSLEEILRNVSEHPEHVQNNAGGHYNHSLFWTILTPDKNTQPSKQLKDAINDQFESLDSLKALINETATKQFGSGWAWLSVDDKDKLFVSSTPNQDNPLMDVVEQKGTPILGIDVWEHAYYLHYQNKRGDYLSSIWKVINWDEVSRRYEAAQKGNAKK